MSPVAREQRSRRRSACRPSDCAAQRSRGWFAAQLPWGPDQSLHSAPGKQPPPGCGIGAQCAAAKIPASLRSPLLENLPETPHHHRHRPDPETPSDVAVLFREFQCGA
ncbi:hypothetical protein AOLI_G00000520 [Acnodon oligacanthus]